MYMACTSAPGQLLTRAPPLVGHPVQNTTIRLSCNSNLTSMAAPEARGPTIAGRRHSKNEPVNPVPMQKMAQRSTTLCTTTAPWYGDRAEEKTTPLGSHAIAKHNASNHTGSHEKTPSQHSSGARAGVDDYVFGTRGRIHEPHSPADCNPKGYPHS